MRWDKFTVMSQESFQAAQAKAEEMGHQEVRPEHLLWSFLSQEENIVAAVFSKLGVNTPRIREDLERAFGEIPKVSGGERSEERRVGKECS
jgi:ATP-dependent Clp protease ATP-binding subunit ClpB